MVADGLPEDPYLYFGNLGKTEPKYKIPNFVGLCLVPRSEREIKHDLNDPLPVPDNSTKKIQAQDVMEHIPKDRVPSLLDEVYRALVPGAFSASVCRTIAALYLRRGLSSIIKETCSLT